MKFARIEDQKKNFLMTVDSINEMIEYWNYVKSIIERCQIQPDDNLETAICKAYILESGREAKSFKRVRDAGRYRIWPNDTNYKVFLETIYPDKNQRAVAEKKVGDQGILYLAQALGYMRVNGRS